MVERERERETEIATLGKSCRLSHGRGAACGTSCILKKHLMVAGSSMGKKNMLLNITENSISLLFDI